MHTIPAPPTSSDLMQIHDRITFHQACKQTNLPEWPGAVAMYITADINMTIDAGCDMDSNAIY